MDRLMYINELWKRAVGLGLFISLLSGVIIGLGINTRDIETVAIGIIAGVAMLVLDIYMMLDCDRQIAEITEERRALE